MKIGNNFNNLMFGAARQQTTNIDLSQIPNLDQRYTIPESTAKTVAVLGISRNEPELAPEMGKMFQLGRHLGINGYSLVSAMGQEGHLGAIDRGFQAGVKVARRERLQTGENLSIIKEPLWGDEHLTETGPRPIGKFSSEGARLEEGFLNVADTIVIGTPGGTTLAEASLAIAANKRAKPPKKIILTGQAEGEYDLLHQQWEQSILRGRLGKKIQDTSQLYEYTDLEKVPAMLPPVNLTPVAN